MSAEWATERRPWGLSRLRRRNAAQSGLIVYGWFNRLVGWLPAKGWEAVHVTIDRSSDVFLDQKQRGPKFIPLPNGRHWVRFNGTRGPLFSTEVTVEDNHVLVDFKPAERVPLREATQPRWRVVDLGPVVQGSRSGEL